MNRVEECAGAEVVQLYASDKVAAGPVYEITGSERRLTAVSVEPGKDER
ncbi:hypothetical protein [Nonomuraea sp. NPDC005650]